jgi:CHASE1-domain containing sensor protein
MKLQIILKQSLRPWALGFGVAAMGIAASVFLARQQSESIDQLERAHLQGLRLIASDHGSLSASPGAAVNSPLFSSQPVDVIANSKLSRELNVYGRKWQLDFQTNMQFVSDTERRTTLLVGLAGNAANLR